MTLKDKLLLSTLTAGAYGWTIYGYVKFVTEDVPEFEWETTSDKLKSAGKYALGITGYVGAATGCLAMLIASVAAWKDK